MKPRQAGSWRERGGKILAMSALMMPVMFGAALVSTDTAVLTAAEAQLKCAADSASLAGAMILADETRLRGTTNLASLMTTSRSKAISIAASNHVLGSPAVLANNLTNTTTGDIVIGYLSPSDYTTATPSTTASQTLFNVVKVTTRRDASHGGPVNTFFGGAVGIGNQNMSVSSTALAQNLAIIGVKNISAAQNVNLLPIVLDTTTYTAMINRTTADQYFYCPPPNPYVSAGADGVPESQLFPVGTGSPGNWGTINVGVSNNSTATLVSQIQSGITPAQMATYSGSKIQLNTSLSPASITFGGNPGISAGIQSALTSQIGNTKVIGIYDTVTGNGNNTTYRVIGFAAVRIMAVNFQGNPKYVVVQPALIKDASVIAGPAQTSWTSGGLVRVRLAR